MRPLLNVALLILLVIGSMSAENVNFVDYGKNTYELARVKAAEEGKLLFIDFYAKWCAPCKWMDETTFVDERVVRELDANFISIKIDIDDMEGFELKSKFDIRYLPTMLVFNTDGKMVERIEETLSPSKLKDILTNHSSQRSKSTLKHGFNTSPRDILMSDNTTDTQEDNTVLSPEEYRKYFSQENTVYRMQLGVFSTYQAASTKVTELRKIFLEEVIIIEDRKSEKTMYKVVMGEFKSLSEAESFRKILKEKYQMDSILY